MPRAGRALVALVASALARGGRHVRVSDGSAYTRLRRAIHSSLPLIRVTVAELGHVRCRRARHPGS